MNKSHIITLIEEAWKVEKWHNLVVATQIFCIFTPIHGETIPIFDEPLFQMNWFNHQLA